MEHETKISRHRASSSRTLSCIARQRVQRSNRPDVPAHDFVNVSRYGPESRKPVINEFAMPLRPLATPDRGEMRRESFRFFPPPSPTSSLSHLPFFYQFTHRALYYALSIDDARFDRFRGRIDRDKSRSPVSPIKTRARANGNTEANFKWTDLVLIHLYRRNLLTLSLYASYVSFNYVLFAI